MDFDERWDAVVIGSGIGGMTAASLLAQLHAKRVLLLERHTRMGGFTHGFSRQGGFHWDVGLHYVGEVSARDRRPHTRSARNVMEVVTGGMIDWNPMPEVFDKLVFPGFTFDIRAGKENFRADLKAAFPDEAVAIDQYLEDVERAASYIDVHGMRGLAPPPVVSLVEFFRRRSRELALVTTGEYLKRRFQDQRLRAVAGARWMDYGVPPAQSAFLIHALITRHYLEGAYFPAGSGGRIGEAATRLVDANGGEVRVGAEVEEILVEDGKAVGVRLAGGRTIQADCVISNVGARNTYLRLLPEHVNLRFRAELETTPDSMTAVVLYLGLKSSPEALGMRGANYWIHDGLDHDELQARQMRVPEGEVPTCFLSFPSLKNPEARAHAAEIIAPVDPACFDQWNDTSWKARGEEYERLKERIADALLGAVEPHVPGFRELIAYRELATPLTIQHFTAHRRGGIYGVPCTPARYHKNYLQSRTPVENLFLTGTDALSPGIVGATYAGLLCTVAVTTPLTFWKVSAAAKRLRKRRARNVNGPPLLGRSGTPPE